ncbi:MAG: leukotriene A4 hydrolase C-terminal domain-containing protein, partial [Bacteroidota bacterium]
MSLQQMTELDNEFKFTESGNSEILEEWFQHVIPAKYEAAYPALEKFLIGIGRLKYLKPLYAELVKTPDGLEIARRIYKQARPGYHPITAGA